MAEDTNPPVLQVTSAIGKWLKFASEHLLSYSRNLSTLFWSDAIEKFSFHLLDPLWRLWFNILVAFYPIPIIGSDNFWVTFYNYYLSSCQNRSLSTNINSDAGYVDENSEIGTKVVDEEGKGIVFVVTDNDKVRRPHPVFRLHYPQRLGFWSWQTNTTLACCTTTRGWRG